ncbi:IMP dehydrogenase [Bacteriovoracaceae bacterium]|nr:IMP dehydrogenase [Bacteriovoracaceae bacterium]
MTLIFNASNVVDRGRGFTFDDILVVPNYSEISSRRHPNLDTKLTRNLGLEVPIVSANMDTITEHEMAIALGSLGGVGIIHRFMDIDAQISEVKKVLDRKLNTPVVASIGVKKEDILRAEKLVDNGVQAITIDIAHGDSVMMYSIMKEIRKTLKNVDIIAGNVATPGGVRRLIEEGADAVKVGIGPGSMCTTRLITGCGVPQLTAIALCSAEARKSSIPIIADGGIKTSGDIVKALCCGASTVMLGSMFAGTLETPGEVTNGEKRYRGMASKEAQISWRGELPEGMAPEGVSTKISCKGSVCDVVREILGGIRSGMTYLNAENISDMEKNASFIEISPAGVKESGPHGTSSKR